MPIFDFKCLACDRTEKDMFVKSWDTPVFCDECEEPMEKIPSRFLADVFPNGGIHLEHVSSNGKTFYSKGEMREYAKANDLELGAL